MTLGPLMLDVAGETLTEPEADRLRNPLVGGVILFSRNFSSRHQVRDLVAAIRDVRTPPLLVAVDQEGGRVQRFREGFYRLPPLRWIGRQFDLDPDQGRRLAHACGWLMATEVLDTGIDFSFAPVLDLDYGTSEVIGDRAFHRDPEIVATLATAYVQGMHKAGMIAVGKHFPGHGYVVADSHLDLPVDARSLEELFDDLSPYSRLIEHGLDAVMIAHVRYPQIDPDVASLSPRWMRDVLRNDYGFRGVVFSDDLSMRALAAEGSMADRARRTLEAGADMALICNDPAGADEALAALEGHEDPVRQARLVGLRRHPATGDPESVAGTVAMLDAAQARPGLALG